jgi:hypothetical protein
MSPESTGSMGLEDARWPDDDWPEDDSDDDDWPGDEADDAPGAPGPPWPPGPPGPARPGTGGPPRRGGIRPLAVAAVAVVALAAGGGIAALVARGAAASSSPTTAQPPGSSQQGGVPGNGGFPGGPVGELLLRGSVVAVSSTSITIAGGGHTVTAAVTSATSVTGKVTSIGSVKVGDVVSAQIRESGGKATATAIQDPARQLSSGGLPPIGGGQP